MLKLPFVTTFIAMQLCTDLVNNLVYLTYYRKGNWIKPVRNIGMPSAPAEPESERA